MRYVAFLRGINVGGNKIIKMDELRKAFAALGFQNVKTLLASGNVLFDASGKKTELVKRIEQQLAKVFGHEIGVILRGIEELQELTKMQLFKKTPVDKNTSFFVTFLSEEIKGGPIEYPETRNDFRILQAAGTHAFSVYVQTPGARSADWMRILEKEFGKKVTTRNWNTVLRILKLTESVS